MERKEEFRAADNTVKTINKKRVFTKWFIALVAVNLIGITCALVSYAVNSENYDSATKLISFNYDNVSQSKTPNGEAFSINSIKKDTIINDALKKANLGSSYTCEEVLNNLDINGIYPKNIIEDSLLDNKSVLDSSSSEVSSSIYVPTQYRITLYNKFNKKLSKANLTRLIDCIAESYKSYFFKTYLYEVDSDDLWSWENFDTKDYSQQINFMSVYLGIIKKYALEMESAYPNYHTSGSNFRDIISQCNEIENHTLSRLSSFVDANSLTKSANKQTDFYNYKIRQLEIDNNSMESELEDLDSLIKSYERDSTKYIGSGDNVTIVGSNSTQTYNSLLDQKISLQTKISENKKEITLYQNNLSDLEKSTDLSKSNTAEEEIAKTKQTVIALGRAYKETLNNFTDAEFNDSIIGLGTSNYNEVSIISLSFLIPLINICVPINLIFLIAFCMYCFVNSYKLFTKKHSLQ